MTVPSSDRLTTIQSDRTTMRLVSVPSIPTEAPATLSKPDVQYIRALVRNVGAVPIMLSTDAVALQAASNVTDIYIIPPGQSDAIALAPQQGLYAAGVGGGGQATVARSVAIPFRFLES